MAISNLPVWTAWATTATGGGIWGPSGVASDGTNIFSSRKHIQHRRHLEGRRSSYPLATRASVQRSANDYWAPPNWHALDTFDTDLGGSADAHRRPEPEPSPGGRTGKDGNAYLLNRDNPGGITAPLTQSRVERRHHHSASATYRTAQLPTSFSAPTAPRSQAYKIKAAKPPTINFGWSVTQNGIRLAMGYNHRRHQ